jgi:hypothetical protein
VRVPVALGLNSIPMVHRPPAAKLDLQLLQAQAVHRAAQKKPTEQHQAALIPLTVLEVRVLLWRLLWHELPSAGLVLNWNRHQAIARRCHEQRCTGAG